MLSTIAAYGPLLITAGACGVTGYIVGYVRKGAEDAKAIDELAQTLSQAAEDLDTWGR